MADNKNDILLKLKIQTDKANAALKKTEVQIKKTIQSFKGLTKGSLQYQEAQARLASQQATYAQQSEKYNNSLRIQTAAQASATKQTNQLASASGGATTSVLELGRIVSDAPYGIRGMANNISQLASNMLFTSQQVDKTSGKIIGFSGVLKQMGKTFMGPLGLLFLIQGAIALLDGFAGGATKAKESTQDLTKEVYANAIVMSGYVDELEDVNISEERRKVVVQELTKTIPTLTAADLEYGKNLDNVRLKIKQYTLAQASRIEMDKLVQENSELLSKQMKVDLINSTEDQEEKIKLIKGLFVDAGIETQKLVQQSYSMGQKSMTLRDKTNKELIRDFKELAKGIKEESDPIIDRIERLSQGLVLEPSKSSKGKGKVKKLSPFATPKELEIDVKNAENAIIQYEKQIKEARLKEELNDKLSEATTEEEKKKIREQYQLDRLKNQLNAEKKMLDLKLATEKKVVNTKRDNHIADLKRATDLYIHKVKLNDKLSAKEKEQMIGIAKSQLQIATNQANTEADDAITQIKDKYKTLFGFFEQLGIARKDALISGFGAVEDDDLTGMEKFAEKFNAISSSVTDFMNGEFDRQMTIEQNKTNALNNELRERLNNESLSAEERKNIQLQIARNDEELRKKQEKIEKKRFRMNKAAQIAGALVNTAAAAAGVMADAKGGFFTRLAQALPTIAFGLGQVAIIARQKFQSSAGATTPAGALGGGGSGSGDNTREFNFNLAGSTQSNQLTQSIAGQLSQPIQTYVVSSEITSQQQLDLNIANTATIGG
jgi:hypothetical protein